MTRTQGTGSSGLIFVPYNGKIADITHADINPHTLNVQTALSESRTVVACILADYRQGGTGVLYTYPNSGVTYVTLTNDRTNSSLTALASNTLTYKLSVANDDFDLYCFGYFVLV